MLTLLRRSAKQLRRQHRASWVVDASALIYHQIRALKVLFLLPISLRALRKEMKNNSTSESSVRTVFDLSRGIIRPVQVRSEITELLALVEERRPKRVLEIGTFNGGTLFLWCRMADPNATIISIDLPGGWFGGGYPAWKRFLYRTFAASGQRLHLLRRDSHRPETFQMVRQLLQNERFDFIFFDGDHRYKGVKQDYEMYSELLSSDGIIALHDIAPNPQDPSCQVHRFWRELQTERECGQEIVEDWRQGGLGIGVLHRPRQ